MTLKTLNNMYPESVIDKHAYDESDYLSLFDGYEYLNIPKDKLTENEEVLLKGYFIKQEVDSDWYKLLVNNKSITNSEFRYVQLIHFKVSSESNLKEAWLQSFSSFFKGTIDYFFIEDDYGVIILEECNLSKQELRGILDVLDEDYSLSTSIYIGSKSELNNISRVFEEERNLFRNSQENHKICSFTDIYVSHYIVNSIKDSVITQQLQNFLKSQDEISDLVISLWKNKGNQSAVAKELYVHRNTINYRIDKLYEELIIDLRDMDQLFLCYILLK